MNELLKSKTQFKRFEPDTGDKGDNTPDTGDSTPDTGENSANTSPKSDENISELLTLVKGLKQEIDDLKKSKKPEPKPENDKTDGKPSVDVEKMKQELKKDLFVESLEEDFLNFLKGEKIELDETPLNVIKTLKRNYKSKKDEENKPSEGKKNIDLKGKTPETNKKQIDRLKGKFGLKVGGTK